MEVYLFVVECEEDWIPDLLLQDLLHLLLLLTFEMCK